MTDRRIKERRKVNHGCKCVRGHPYGGCVNVTRNDDRVPGSDRRVASTPRDKFQDVPAPGAARRAAERIFDLFKNASYFSTRNAEHKSQMLDGWAALIDEEFSAYTPRETAASGEARGHYSREELCERLDSVTEERNELISEDTNLRGVLADVLKCPGFWHGQGGILEAIAKLAAAPALPQVTTEEAREWLRGRCVESDWLWNNPPAAKIAKLLAAFANRPAPAAPGKEEK